MDYIEWSRVKGSDDIPLKLRENRIAEVGRTTRSASASFYPLSSKALNAPTTYNDQDIRFKATGDDLLRKYGVKAGEKDFRKRGAGPAGG